MTNIEAVVKRKDGRWVAREVERSGGGGEHGGGDDDDARRRLRRSRGRVDGIVVRASARRYRAQPGERRALPRERRARLGRAALARGQRRAPGLAARLGQWPAACWGGHGAHASRAAARRKVTKR